MALRVTAVEAVSDHDLRLTFSDGLVRDMDMAPMMWGELGEPLRNPSFFRRVRVDDASRTIAWPNGFEPDPDVLHGDYSAASPGRSGHEPARRRAWARLRRGALRLGVIAAGTAVAARIAARIVTSR